MQKMSGLDLSFAVGDAQAQQGKRIAKIRKTEGGLYLFKIGSGEILFEPGVRWHPTRQAMQATDAPDGFVAFLRKNFEGKTAAKIWQAPNERIVEIEAKSKERLVFELFRKGNLLAVTEGGIIAACLMREEASGRKIAVGEKYCYPKATGFEFKRPEKIAFAVQLDGKGNPASYSLDAARGGKEFPSFSEAADFYYANQREETSGQKAAAEKMGKLSGRLASQEEALIALAQQREEAKKCGDAIYANFEAVEELLSLVRQLKKSGKSEEEIGRELALHKAKISGSNIDVEL
jgi:predicted ribosome quality control (RQC) complex YloA/Tae2 family protein